MSEWRIATVSELEAEGSLLVQDGNHGNDRPRPDEFVVDGVVFVRAADLEAGRVRFDRSSRINQVAFERIRKGHGQPGDSLLSHKGTVGKVAFVEINAPTFVCSPQTTFWRSTNAAVLDKKYVYFLLRSPHFVAQLEAQKGETDMAPYVSLTQQRQLRVMVPPIVVQQSIAEVLGALDDKIAANTALATTAGSTIETAFARACSFGTNESPLLDELIIEFGEPFGGAHFSAPDQGRPLIRIRDLKTFSSQVWTTEAREKEIVVQRGDIVVGMDAEFRATSWLGEPGLLNQRVMRGRHKQFGNALVREVLRKPLAEVESEKSATTVIHLNKSDLARKLVLLPMAERLREFELLAEPIYSAAIALAAESRTLASTRDALLPQLMSGKLRVRDAEATASAAGL